MEFQACRKFPFSNRSEQFRIIIFSSEERNEKRRICHPSIRSWLSSWRIATRFRGSDIGGKSVTVRIWGNVFGVTRRRQESHRWFIYAQWLIRPGFTPKSCTCVRARACACARYRPRFTSYLRYRTAPRAGREKNFFPLSFPIIPSPSFKRTAFFSREKKEGENSLFLSFSFPSGSGRD